MNSVFATPPVQMHCNYYTLLNCLETWPELCRATKRTKQDLAIEVTAHTANHPNINVVNQPCVRISSRMTRLVGCSTQGSVTASSATSVKSCLLLRCGTTPPPVWRTRSHGARPHCTQPPSHAIHAPPALKFHPWELNGAEQTQEPRQEH